MVRHVMKNGQHRSSINGLKVKLTIKKEIIKNEHHI